MSTNHAKSPTPFKRILSAVLCCIALLSLFPTVALAAQLRVTAKKTLEGASLQGGDFSFQLTGEINGDEVDMPATNDSNGDIIFVLDIPDGTPPGDYDLYIEETDDGVDGMTYDLTSKNLILRINNQGGYELLLRNDNGTYTAGGIPIFRNTYRDPSIPSSPPPITPPTPAPPTISTPPQTGDNAPITLWLAFVIMSFAGFVTIIISDIKKKLNPRSGR